MTRTIHAVHELQVVHSGTIAQERPAGIYCAVSVDTNNTKSMYKVGKVTHAALNNEPCLLIYCSTMTCKEGPAKIYSAMMMIMNTEYT